MLWVGGGINLIHGGNLSPQTNVLLKALPRLDDSIEPVFYYALPFALYKDLFQANNISGVVNLTGADGAAELAAMELGIPCISFCLTSDHVSMLYKWMESRVWHSQG
jgi:hypothetical protein